MQMFYFKYCKIFKNIFFVQHLLMAASDFKTATEQRWAAASVLTLLISSGNLLNRL